MFENTIDKKLEFNGARKKLTKQVQYIVLHHSGASADQTVEQIHAYHLGKGWIGVGYNLLVDKNGNMYWGRGIDYVGAHCKGYNEISIGICAIGNMETDTMTKAQKENIIKLVREVKEYYPSISKIVGHKELEATSCPGKNYPLSEIINAANENIDKNSTEKQSCEEALLKEGDIGNNVSAMQSKLVALKYDLGYIDGIFGVKTKAALIAYQKAKSLSETGCLDSNTYAHLNEDVAEFKLPQIKKGSTGEYVKMLERLLDKRKYSLEEDGIFGKLTEAAVISFQKKSGLGADGIVGVKTWHALLS